MTYLALDPCVYTVLVLYSCSLVFFFAVEFAQPDATNETQTSAHHVRDSGVYKYALCVCVRTRRSSS